MPTIPVPIPFVLLLGDAASNDPFEGVAEEEGRSASSTVAVDASSR